MIGRKRLFSRIIVSIVLLYCILSCDREETINNLNLNIPNTNIESKEWQDIDMI